MNPSMTAGEIKKLLGLEPHPVEGGYFRRTYTSPGIVELERGIRRQGTAIFYLLEPGTFSEMHVLDSDEIFHFYLGDPVEMLQLLPDGSSAL
jgi:predicted cupin superfamily sugar epimerase